MSGHDREQYLRAATRGLWGRKRREVREELEAHLEDRVLAHRLAGLGEREALARTLRELGHPSEVSAGMVRLHTLPTLVGSGAVLAAACAVAVTVVTSGAAQSLPVTDFWPSPTCSATAAEGKTPDRCYSGSELWTSVGALEKVLEPQGVEVSEARNILTLEFPGSQRVFYSLTEGYPLFDPTDPSVPEVLREERSYLRIWNLIERVAVRLPVALEGWDKPSIRLGNASFQLQPVGASVQNLGQRTELYLKYLWSVASQNLMPFRDTSDVIYFLRAFPEEAAFPEDAWQFRAKRFKVPVKEQKEREVYGVVTMLPPPNKQQLQKLGLENTSLPDLGVLLDVAPARPDGTLTLRLPEGPITFVDALGAAPEPGTSLLVRLTGVASGNEPGYAYEVVPPEEIEQP